MEVANLNEFTGREMQAYLKKRGVASTLRKVVKRRFTGHYTAEFYAPNLDSSVASATEFAKQIEKALPVEVIEARDTRAEWRPGKPIIAASVTFAVTGKALAAVEAQQQPTPQTPAQVDDFLFGVDVARLNAAALHDAGTVDQAQGSHAIAPNMSPREIEEYQTQQEWIEATLVEKNARIQQLEALLQEAMQVCAPCANGIKDKDVSESDEFQWLWVQNKDAEYASIIVDEETRERLMVHHLRAVAAVAAKLDTALKSK